MKGIKIILILILMAMSLSFIYADETSISQMELYDLNSHINKNDSRPAVKFGWLFEKYDFDQIEGFFQNRYGEYYRYYERYINDKQQEIANKFGLTSIYIRPNFRKYDDSKLIFTKSILNDRLTLRYLAPFYDISDFEILMAFRPNKSLNLIVRSEVNGESSIAIAVTYPLGSRTERSDNTGTMRNTGRIIRKVVGIKI
ncbi:MAG: hypothetical protein ACPL7B_15555 [Candidatus Poribacteria bacterium]